MDEILNGHNKNEYPPMHTAEHIVNRTMVNMFGCGRSKNAHIERKKSKISEINKWVENGDKSFSKNIYKD